MKSIFYILSILALLAAAYFANDLKEKYTAQIGQTNDLKGKITDISRAIEQKEADVKSATSDRDQARSKKDETNAQLEVQSSNTSGLNAKLSSVKTRSEEAQAQLDEVTALITNARQQAPGIEIDELPAEIKRLQDKKNSMETQLEELELSSDKLEKSIEKAREDIKREQQLLADSRKRVRSNRLTGTVQNVNREWGFVTVNIGKNDGVTETTKFLVRRGGKLVGQLEISSLQPNQAICEVVDKSLARGARILPGDKVILAETVAN